MKMAQEKMRTKDKSKIDRLFFIIFPNKKNHKILLQRRWGFKDIRFVPFRFVTEVDDHTVVLVEGGEGW